MKKTTKIMVIIVVSTILLSVSFNVEAEKEQQFTEFNIHIRNGKKCEDGKYRYKNVSQRIDGKKLTVYCIDPGDLECPVEITVLVTIVTGVPQHDAMMTAIDQVKDKIFNGERKGKLVYRDILYSWGNGILHQDGQYEMNLSGIPYSMIQ